MEMTRTIHPIGQGAFYTECLENGSNTYNVVYDCGSETTFSGKGKLIDKEITQTFKNGEIINALFISHFHNDHINGIEKLLKHCNVEYIFLPIIDNISKLLLITSNDDKDFVDFILSPIDYIKNISDDTTVISVHADNLDNNYNTQQLFDLSQEESKKDGEIKSGTKIVLSGYNIKWEYIPFNFNNQQLIMDIEKAYKDNGRVIPDANKLDKVEFDFAKKIFNQVLKSWQKRNAHSMILYSGSYLHKDWICRAVYNDFCGYKYCHHRCYYHEITTGCIYFGDFDLNIRGALKNILSKYNIDKDNISIMQVPHHGSIYNFNINVFSAFPRLKLLFVSAGEKNKYRHPSSTVVKNILKTGRHLKLITENKSSMLQFIYEEM